MIITQETLRDMFDYCDGFLIWRKPPHKKGPQRVGSIAGCKDVLGYWRIGIDKHRYYAHRLIWLWHYGVEPNVIDHINGIKSDNRVENLRACTRAENQRNLGMIASNKTGMKGVHWVKSMNRWKGVIGANGKQYHCGYFDDPDQAKAAVERKRLELHGEFANPG